MRRKLAIIGFSYLCGSVFASVFIDGAASFVLTCTASFVIICLFVIQKRMAVVLASVSFVLGNISFGTVYLFKIAPAKALDDGNVYNITAKVNEVTPLENDLSSCVLSTDINGVNVLIALYSGDISCAVGDTVHLTAKLKSTHDLLCPEYESYLFSRGVFLKAASVKELSVTKQGSGGIINAILDYREYILEKLTLQLPNERSSLMRAMFFGDKCKLLPLEQYEITASGAAHLTAVSGMHLTLIIAVFASLLDLIGIGRLPRTKIIITVNATLAFMVFFRLTASVLRAGIMLCIFYIGKLFFARSDCLNSVGLALIVILLANPLACKDIGLIFSCVTTVGAGHLSPILAKAVCEKLEIRRGEFISLLCCCLCCALTSIPISMLCFGTFSAVSVIVSLLCLPFFTVCVICILLYTLSGGMLNFLLYPAHFGCEVMRGIFSLFARLPFSHFKTEPIFSLYFVVGALFVGIFLYAVLKKRRIIHMTAYCIFAAALLYVHCLIPYLTAQDAEIISSSDGSGGFVIVKDNGENYAVLLGGGKKNVSALYAEMMSENISRFDVLHIAYDDKNVIPYLGTLEAAADVTVFDGEGLSDDTFTADNFYNDKVSFDSSTCGITVNGVKINISSVADIKSDAINFCYGYKKELSAVMSPVFFFNKKQEADNAVNLYRSSVKVLINSEGKVLVKESL